MHYEKKLAVLKTEVNPVFALSYFFHAKCLAEKQKIAISHDTLVYKMANF